MHDLKDLPVGVYTIARCDDERLLELGFIPGRRIELIRKGFTSVVRLGGTKYAIRIEGVFCEA